MSIGVEIVLQISHNILTRAEVYIYLMKGNRLKVEIAQLSCAISGVKITPKRKIPYIDIRFSTDREPVGSQDFTLSGEGVPLPTVVIKKNDTYLFNTVMEFQISSHRNGPTYYSSCLDYDFPWDVHAAWLEIPDCPSD
jgi:hypothetical protein